LVYDITRRDTFQHVQGWLDDAMQHSSKTMTTILIGNKCDLERQRAVSYEEGEKFAKDHNIAFMECSAKSATNVDQAFKLTAMRIFDKIKNNQIIVGNDDTTCGVKAGSLLKKGSDDGSTVKVTDSEPNTGSNCTC
jgi:Ras-related protein Rab-2A